MKFSLLPVLCSLLCFLSCSVNQEIRLNTDGSGTVYGEVFLEDFFLATLQDLTDLNNPVEGDLTPMDPAVIESELKRNPYFDSVAISSEGPGRYRGTLSFHDVEDLFFSPEKGETGSVLSFSELDNRTSRLILRINSDNFQELFRLFPMLQDPGFQYFLPEPAITRQEYIEMLLFLFDENSLKNDRDMTSLLNTASLNLRINVNGTILSREGGTQLDESSIRITVPLLSLLLHEEELYYSVTFQSR